MKMPKPERIPMSAGRKGLVWACAGVTMAGAVISVVFLLSTLMHRATMDLRTLAISFVVVCAGIWLLVIPAAYTVAKVMKKARAEMVSAPQKGEDRLEK